MVLRFNLRFFRSWMISIWSPSILSAAEVVSFLHPRKFVASWTSVRRIAFRNVSWPPPFPSALFYVATDNFMIQILPDCVFPSANCVFPLPPLIIWRSIFPLSWLEVSENNEKFAKFPYDFSSVFFCLNVPFCREHGYVPFRWLRRRRCIFFRIRHDWLVFTVISLFQTPNRFRSRECLKSSLFFSGSK